MRFITTLLISLLAALALSSTALAADVDEIATELNLRGYFIEEGARGDVNAMEALVSETGGDDLRWYFVSLAADPEGGADLFARRISEFIDDSGTILVDGPGEVGADSADFFSEQIDGAIDNSLPDLRDSFEGGSEAFYRDLSGRQSAEFDDSGEAIIPEAPIDEGAPPDAGERSNSGLGWLVIIGGIFGISMLWRAIRRRKKNSRQRVDDTDAARRELRAQMDALASSIVDRSDMVGLEGNEQATTYYREANATYTSALADLDTADSLADLAGISARVDRARWQLEAAEALVEGRAVPPEPAEDELTSCFFDPTHAAGTESAEIQTSAGARTVKVCRADAEKLRRGERPTSRTITVGDRRVPAGMAPRSHGGQGMGGLGAFSILLQGLAQGINFDWSSRGPSNRDRPRMPGGIFGTDMTTRRGTRSRTARPRTRRSSGRRRSSIGRARRKK